jgi:hypothetical protein
MDERLSRLKKAAQQASLANKRLTAKSLWDKLRKEEANLREGLEKLEERYDLALELHAPSGQIIRIGEVGYYPDTNDTLRVQGIDVETRVQCNAIVPVESFYGIFRITPLEGSELERKPIGFHVERAEGSE